MLPPTRWVLGVGTHSPGPCWTRGTPPASRGVLYCHVKQDWLNRVGLSLSPLLGAGETGRALGKSEAPPRTRHPPSQCQGPAICWKRARGRGGEPGGDAETPAQRSAGGPPAWGFPSMTVWKGSQASLLSARRGLLCGRWGCRAVGPVWEVSIGQRPARVGRVTRSSKTHALSGHETQLFGQAMTL